VELLASIWSEEGLETARQVEMQRYKVAHQMVDKELIGKLAKDGKPMFVSLVDHDSDRLKKLEPAELERVTCVYCSPYYPTYPEQLGMPFWFGGGGYSDHTFGIEAALLAASRGASYIEVHFCLDKTDLVVRDTPFAKSPAEFRQLVELGNGIGRLISAGA
jgi:sialic acid synthase SpsE